MRKDCTDVCTKTSELRLMLGPLEDGAFYTWRCAELSKYRIPTVTPTTSSRTSFYVRHVDSSKEKSYDSYQNQIFKRNEIPTYSNGTRYAISRAESDQTSTGREANTKRTLARDTSASRSGVSFLSRDGRINLQSRTRWAGTR